jgi:hypothetical protein
MIVLNQTALPRTSFASVIANAAEGRKAFTAEVVEDAEK